MYWGQPWRERLGLQLLGVFLPNLERLARQGKVDRLRLLTRYKPDRRFRFLGRPASRNISKHIRGQASRKLIEVYKARKDSAALYDLARHGQGLIRRLAALELAKAGDARVLGTLRSLLRSDLGSREQLITGMGGLGARAVCPLIEYSLDDGEICTKIVAKALRTIPQAKGAARPLLDKLLASLQNKIERLERCQAQHLTYLKRCLTDQLELVGVVGDARFHATVATLLEQEDRDLWRVAALTLVALQWAPSTPREVLQVATATQTWPKNYTFDPDSLRLLCEEYALALAQARPGRRDTPVIRGLLAAIAAIGGSEAERLFGQAFANDDSSLCSVAAKLAEEKDAVPVRLLTSFLTHHRAEVRERAARALSKAGWEPKRDVLGALHHIALQNEPACLALGAVTAQALTGPLATTDLWDGANYPKLHRFVVRILNRLS